ncbi:uncharacterized protein [Montipora capricornis]|uniref:uncharacterized protein n=1 Tax=Montipora capricornis TaxID=246305 RepID=UPI0035F1B940
MPKPTKERNEGGARPAIKRTREGSSQTDDEADSTILERLTAIEEKLTTILQLVPELEGYKCRLNNLEEENKKRLRVEHDELCRQHIKLESHSRRDTINFFGVKEKSHESNADTEEELRNFLRSKLKIPSSDEVQINFERVHRMNTRVSDSKKQRPIIAKVSQYQDKNFIKSFIKNLPKSSKYGISDDYPKEIDEIRKKLYSVLKAAKKEKKSAYFNVDKLIIDDQIYRGPETANLPLYGRIMSS